MAKVKIDNVKPNGEIYIGESVSKKIFAKYLFDKDDEDNDVPKRGLVFGVLDAQGKVEDNLFEIKHTPTDEIKEKYFPTTISVPRGEGTIVPGQRRGIFIKHKDEVIVDGKCPTNSNTCSVLTDAFIIINKY